RFCPGNAYDFRVIAMGRQRLILRRGNRDHVPFASGSDREMPSDPQDDAETAEVFDFANEFFAAEDFRWCGIDIVRDREAGRWVVLEVTAAWPTPANIHRFALTRRPMSEFWTVVCEEIEAGVFG